MVTKIFQCLYPGIYTYFSTGFSVWRYSTRICFRTKSIMLLHFQCSTFKYKLDRQLIDQSKQFLDQA